MIISKQEFNQNHQQAFTQNEPVFITEQGQITNVVLSYDEYQKIQQQLNSHTNVTDVATLLSCGDSLDDETFEQYFTKANIHTKPMETDS